LQAPSFRLTPTATLEALNTMLTSRMRKDPKLRVDMISMAQREGKLGEDYHAFVDQLLGLDEQARHNASAVGRVNPALGWPRVRLLRKCTVSASLNYNAWTWRGLLVSRQSQNQPKLNPR